MGLSEDFIDEHVSKWEKALDRPYYPYRKKWPSRLFHHAPIENAVTILRDGNLRSRNDPHNNRPKDVAGQGVIIARGHAHDYARLYFRPRTPTQWHIEGIRKSGECAYGDAAHAPILIMMVFDARRVLLQNDINFCDRNMQLGSAEYSNTEDYFSKIPFEKVFHEGGTGGDRSITDHRCAEVLAMSPLSLDKGVLQWIYCRTEAEKLTLLHMLGDDRPRWEKRIIVSDDLLVFERKYVFVDEVAVVPSGLVFRFNPRADRRAIDVRISVRNAAGGEIIRFHNMELKGAPSPPHTRWRIDKPMVAGRYLVQIDLEGHLAFRSHLTLSSDLF